MVVTGQTGVNYGIVTTGNVGRVDVASISSTAISCLHLCIGSKHSLTLFHMQILALVLAPHPSWSPVIYYTVLLGHLCPVTVGFGYCFAYCLFSI